MAQEVHYEIFKRVGARAGWSLYDVMMVREDALAAAQALMADSHAAAVKVVKETYNSDTGDYLTLKIYEDGHNQVTTKPEAEDIPHAIPCFKPDDLYSYHARATMARVLAEYLSRQKLTVTELIHRGDALEKFEATGTLYQHAIQKIAVAQASTTTATVQQIVKSLNELATKAIHRVYRDERRKYFPSVSPGGFAALAAKLANEPDGGYRLNGAIARHLAGATGWNDKVVRLLAVMSEAEGEGAGLLLESVDAIVAEALNGSAALHELIGDHENLGAALATLVSIFLGQAPDGGSEGIALIARHFAADRLPSAQTAIAGRILAELKSVKRLCPGSLVEELRTLRRIANKLVAGQGKYLSHEDLIAAFTLRSRRLVTHESIGQHLAEADTPDAKLERLLLVEENIIGAENKRQLATFMTPILHSPSFETQFLFAKTPLLQRLKRLAELQVRVRRSGFQDKQRDEIADALDALAAEAEARGRLLASIDGNVSSNVEKAIAILRLFVSGALTEGKLSARARQQIIGYLSRPGFLSNYAAQTSCGDTDKAMSELMLTLEKAGITAETGLKNIAA
ncbi:MAG TPA: hypothetical protein VLW75_05245 [Rhizomicrobium sp.]|nr:hypothetical protein [Rhizomicrobium sp.]